MEQVGRIIQSPSVVSLGADTCAIIAWEPIPVPPAGVNATAVTPSHLFLSLEGSLSLPGAWEPHLYQLKLAIFNKTQTENVEEKATSSLDNSPECTT